MFVDTQGLVETLPIIGDETLVLSYSTPSGEGTKTSTDSVTNRESRTQAEETYKQRFKVYDIQEVRAQERANFYKLFFISEEYIFSSKMDGCQTAHGLGLWHSFLEIRVVIL